MRWRAQIAAQVGDLSLDVDLGGGASPVALVGPNGGGKTTLLRIIAGARTADRGVIEVGDATLWDPARGIDRPPESRSIGYVPQGYALFSHLRVVDNVAFGLSTGRRRAPRAARRATARSMLETLGIAALADRLPRSLSGGEAQRVALARALVTEPDLVLMDEPLAAMDAGARRRLRHTLAEHLVARGRPALIVTHDLRDAEAMGAEIYVLERGRVVQRGTADALRRAPATPFVAELVGADLR